MKRRTWLILPALIVALVAGAVLLASQRQAGAQGPEDTGDTGGLALEDVVDAGPPTYLAPEGTDAPEPQEPATDGAAVELASHASSFTYQGRLLDAGRPANGAYDLRFVLYDAEVGGAQVGGILTQGDVPVSGGLFTVVLDFGASAFDGGLRYLEIGVRPGDSTDPYALLVPRRRITPTPYATFAYNADLLDGRDATSFASAGHTHDERYLRIRQGTQFNGTLNVGQTLTYFTFGWPTDEVVYWSMHPTTANGRVDWTVDILLADNGRFTYYITIRNTGSVATSFAARYTIFR